MNVLLMCADTQIENYISSCHHFIMYSSIILNLQIWTGGLFFFLFFKRVHWFVKTKLEFKMLQKNIPSFFSKQFRKNTFPHDSSKAESAFIFACNIRSSISLVMFLKHLLDIIYRIILFFLWNTIK